MALAASDATRNTAVQYEGDNLVVRTGGSIVLETGAKLIIGTTDVTAGAGGSNVAGVAGGYKVARGQLSTATAADTVVTGLATVVSVVAGLDSDPTDNPEWVTATIGDQAGSPAAGSVIIKTWQNTSGTDPTPAAAGTFSKKVNWICVGT
jgi:hypothetical protein